MVAFDRRVLGCGFVLVAAVAFGGEGILAQQAPPTPAPLEARINDVARALQSRPRLKNLSEKQRENLVNFIAGNMLFVMLHELGHGAMSEFNIPITGREEDAADNFAIINLLQVGSAFSHRILVEATRGWFLSDRRDRDDKEPLEFYDDHSLDKQRAYQIVCVMVGSEPGRIQGSRRLVTKLPEDRQKPGKRDCRCGRFRLECGTEASLAQRRSAEDEDRRRVWRRQRQV